MLKKILLSAIIFCQASASAQTPIIKDLDGDLKMDSVYIDADKSVIVCRLSTQNFKKIVSESIELLNEQSGISPTKNGFEFWNNWMRAGYSNQFRYDKPTNKIQLIGMSRYEFGNAANDGSGKSSVNLLTNKYQGDWNYFDEKKEKLVKIPTINTTMNFPKIYLEAFSDKTYFDYAERCSKLYESSKPAGK